MPGGARSRTARGGSIGVHCWHARLHAKLLRALTTTEILNEIQKLPLPEQRALAAKLQRELPVKVESHALPESTEEELARREREFEQLRLAEGLISEIPPRIDYDDEDEFEPMKSRANRSRNRSFGNASDGSLFFDRSALVKRFAKEQGTRFVVGLFRPFARHWFAAAQFTEVEVCAVLARKLKGKQISAPQADKARKRFRRDFPNRFMRITPNALLLEEAVRLATTHALRGYDAIQLASALAANQRRLQVGLTPLILVSADSELNQAAQAEGLAVEDSNNYP